MAGPRAPCELRQWALLLAIACLLGPTAALRSLQTYFFDVDHPEVQLLPQGSGRPGRTPRVKLSGAAAVGAYMPVVSPRLAGAEQQQQQQATNLVHVVNTWNALKNYALMFARVDALNNQAAPKSPRLFPVPGIAVTAAVDNPAATMDVAAVIDAAEARGQRGAWTETSPASVLLIPTEQSVAAVADIMGITHDAAADTITLALDIVHDPDMVTEFEDHGKQTLDAKTSHYHLFTPPNGVKVDAAGLLKVLQESDYKLAGLHVFVKGGAPCTTACDIKLKQTTDAGGVTTVEARTDPQGDYFLERCSVVTFSLSGSYERVGASSCRVAEASNVPSAVARTGSGTETAQTTSENVAWLAVRALGTLRVTVTYVDGQPVVRSDTLTIGGASKLVLSPARACAHVHKRVAINIDAIDDTYHGVPNVAISFYAAGDCDPSLTTVTATTDVNGRAAISISAKRPGAVAVVAAATGTNGASLVTPAAHIIFSGDRDEYGEGEACHHHDYGRDRVRRYATRAEGYGKEQEEGPDADSDAERFAAEATKGALALLPA